jgi:DNA replication protein DnaC
MSRQLDQMIADAGTKNLSFAQALESLADMELESRNRRAIERRFRCSRLVAQHSIDSFHFKHHKSRMELKNRILRLLDLEFLSKGTSAIFIGNPGVGKTFFGKNHRLACLSSQSARSLHYRHGHAESSARFTGGSLARP